MSYSHRRLVGLCVLGPINSTSDYDLDAADQLIYEYTNMFVEQLSSHFAQGTNGEQPLVAGSRVLGVTEMDPAGPGIRLLDSSDPLTGTQLNTDRWRVVMYPNVDAVGMEIRQNSGLLMAFPRGYSNIGVAAMGLGPNGSYNIVADPYGIDVSPSNSPQMGVELKNQIYNGAFTVQVDFSDFQTALSPTDSGANTSFGIKVRDAAFESAAGFQLTVGANYLSPTNYKCTGSIIGGSGGTPTPTTAPASGTFQVAVDALGNVTLSCVIAGVTTTLQTGTGWNPTNPLYISLYVATQSTVFSVRFVNFLVTVGSPAQGYAKTGLYTSSVYDAGTSVTWKNLNWLATTPASTSVKFQIATSNSPNGPWTYLGPAGTSAWTDQFTTSGQAIQSAGTPITARYLRYAAALTGPGTSTPELTQVMATYSATSQMVGYTIDASGNITGKATQTITNTATPTTTTVTEARTANSLNQITQNVVTTAGPTVTTYNYTFNADGTLATKTDGTNTWAYTWDAIGDQRLLSMSYNGVIQVAFSYDGAGRMLTRTPYSGGVAQSATKFEWDGWIPVREFTPTGTFRYYAPQGELLTFDYTTGGTTTTYCVHADALGSVRAVTGPAGTVLAHYEYDSWGNQLGSSADLTPSFAYRFQGSIGVRWDATLGMYYCRRRWYDAALQRWISRDRLRSINRYVALDNNPSQLVDLTGLRPVKLSGPQQTNVNNAIKIIQQNSPGSAYTINLLNDADLVQYDPADSDFRTTRTRIILGSQEFNGPDSETIQLQLALDLVHEYSGHFGRGETTGSDLMDEEIGAYNAELDLLQSYSEHNIDPCDARFVARYNSARRSIDSTIRARAAELHFNVRFNSISKHYERNI